MTLENDITVRFFATRDELDHAYVMGEKLPGQVFALEGIDPDVLAYLIATPWLLPADDESFDDIDSV